MLIFIAGFAGPRYDPLGNVVAHSILGNYDDFHREAISRGDLLVYRDNFTIFLSHSIIYLFDH